jgi:hypothetical protein
MSIEGEVVEVSDGDVSFVGGRAVEQQTSGETPDGAHGDELVAAKAAVKAALAGAKTTYAPAETDGTSESTVSMEDSDADADRTALQRALKERKELAKYKSYAAKELESSRDEARKVYQELQREKQELANERKRMELLRKDPIRAIKENGWDAESFILDIASDGTPEGNAKRQQKELIERLERTEAWQKQQSELLRAQQESAQQQERAKFRQDVERQFLATAGARAEDGSHKNVHLVSMYKDDPSALIVQADLVANRYREATGEEASFADITEYLEEQASRWYKSISKAKTVPQSGAVVTKGSPPQAGLAGKKSLSPDGSSERRTLGVTTADLDGEERREAAMAAVRAALHASGQR